MTNTPGHIELERSIDSIRIGSRHRTDLGDIDLLAASIEERGLLQPITVTPDGTLVCGARRLAALRQLGVRKLNVWVRSGISERLTQLLAEQDDNTLHKPLSPTEAATLYREVKVLLAEDAKRRQQATRFGSDQGNPRSHGAAATASPSQLDGTVRTQAALFVTGRRSYTMLERIGELQRIADDESLDDALRSRAKSELDLIHNGGSVSSAHHRMNTQFALSELERMAADHTQPSGVRQESTMGVTRVHAAAPMTPEADLERLAQEALARAKTATKSRKTRTSPTADTKLPVRSFVFLWNDLGEWWLHYDPAEIASQLTDEQWEQIEATLAGTIAFADRLRHLREDLPVARRTAAVGSSVG